MKVVIHYNLITELNCVAILLFQNKSSSPVQTDSIDSSSSILMLHYDMDIKVAYVAGKVFLQNTQLINDVNTAQKEKVPSQIYKHNF